MPPGERQNVTAWGEKLHARDDVFGCEDCAGTLDTGKARLSPSDRALFRAKLSNGLISYDGLASLKPDDPVGAW